MSRLALAGSTWLCLVLLATAAAGQRAAEACGPEGATPATIAGVNARAELVLADGRTIKLAAVALPDGAPERASLAAAARGALSQWLAGHEVMVRPVLADPDRWGRTVAHVFALPDFSDPRSGPPMSAAAVLVDAGLARVRSAPETRDCAAALLASEAEARRNRLGLWADPYYAVLDATDSVRLADRAGLFVLVEGQVTRVGHGRTRTYLNFGHSRGSLSITILKRYNAAFEAAGMAPESLVGTRVRVRGVLDTRFGPQIGVSDPGEIERLEAP